MKPKILMILLFVLAGLTGPSGAGENRETLTPDGSSGQIVVVTRADKDYYALSPDQENTISVRGPGRLRILTRMMFRPEEADRAHYSVQYRLDGGTTVTRLFKNVKRSAQATFRDGTLGVPGQMRDFFLELGLGEHSLALSCPGRPVLTRYFFYPQPERRTDWIPLTPERPNEPVDLIANETEYHYYRFSGENPLRFSVIGPTRVRVMTRVENHVHMKGRIHYRVQVRQGQEIVNTFRLSSRRSQTTVYKGEDRLLPGKAREIVVSVPGGAHSYEIYPCQDRDATLLGRLLFPREAVEN